MEEKSKSPSFYVFNVAGLLLVLSVVGSTLRFAVVSVTLVSWLQTQWLAYTSFLKRRHSARLAAAADQDRTRRKKQIAEISAEVGENVVALLDERRQKLVLRLDREADRKGKDYNQDIVKRIADDLARFQETELAKDEQRLRLREQKISQREKELKEKEDWHQELQEKLENRAQEIQKNERELQIRQKKSDEQEQRMKDTEQRLLTQQKARRALLEEWEGKLEKLRLQQEPKVKSRVVSQPAISPSPPSVVNKPIVLPPDLLAFAEDLKSYHFTCIGVTKKGTRCGQSMISNFDKSSAMTRIERMVSPSPADAVLFDMKALRELADWMLCPRWHRDKLPQGAGIANRWYHQLSDARAQLENQRATEFKTPESAGVPSLFGSASTGTTASSFGSSGYQSKGFHFGGSSMPPAFGQQLFGGSAAKNLKPVFESMSQESATARNGFGQW